MVKSQIYTSILDFFGGHNLCYKYSNGLCEPILNTYISRNFQYYKKNFNPMNFDPWKFFLKIRKSVGTPIPKMGVHLGVCGFIPSHFLALWECKCDYQVALSAHTFPCLCFGCEPKSKVMTNLGPYVVMIGIYGRFTKAFNLVIIDGLEIADTRALAIFPKFYV